MWIGREICRPIAGRRSRSCSLEQPSPAARPLQTGSRPEAFFGASRDSEWILAYSAVIHLDKRGFRKLASVARPLAPTSLCSGGRHCVPGCGAVSISRNMHFSITAVKRPSLKVATLARSPVLGRFGRLTRYSDRAIGR